MNKDKYLLRGNNYEEEGKEHEGRQILVERK